MITLVDRFGNEVKGEWLYTTETHYVLGIDGKAQMFRIADWEEKRK